MNKIYQKMYLANKNRSGGVLDGFTRKAVGIFYSKFHRSVARSAGFTLIELLVVVLIIGILAAIAVPQYQVAVAKSKAMDAMVQLKAITDAQEPYYLSNGEYTNDLADLGLRIHENGYLYTTYYYFQCFQNRSCVGSPHSGEDGVILEFTLLHDPTYHGKHWCHALTERQKRICSSLGPVDTEYGNGNYFLLN